MVFVNKAQVEHPRVDVRGAVLRYPTGPYAKRSFKSGVFGLLGRRKDIGGKWPGFITALSDINLAVNSGERVGIIGGNGAGKSSMLRVLAGIYPLAAGSVSVYGRIQTLFNIDLGFEIESTGRENILYRGLAMGVKPDVVRSREREIVEFADIGAFIDLPMRTYSSGMTVRLAFAIASYLDGDVLLIDEVFGAGDASFQSRAIERMEQMIGGAEVVVFVSHDMGTVTRLCNRVLWMESGRIRQDGPAESVVRAYLSTVG